MPIQQQHQPHYIGNSCSVTNSVCLIRAPIDRVLKATLLENTFLNILRVAINLEVSISQ